MHAPSRRFSTSAKSSYIWTGEQTGMAHTAPTGDASILCGDSLLSHEMPYLRDNHRSLCPVYVNGQQIGPGGSPQQGAVVSTADLNPDSNNVFGVTNTAESSAGLIATILVDYTDGTTETIVSNSMWKTLKGAAPGGWTSSSFDDSVWTTTDVERPSTASPWGSPALPPASNMKAAE
ncbi:hypothetical protein F5146DRAFT_1203653 [Armillaria mellea]|nr:hypothetical protein F5146DRAFT_1203653 [Armillaria mellea]